jgi:hypothetical protein
MNHVAGRVSLREKDVRCQKGREPVPNSEPNPETSRFGTGAPGLDDGV